MGNSGSSRQEARQQESSKYHQHKVLLDLDATPRLRPTQNGAIILGGGTISQRHKLQRDLYGSEPDLRYGSGHQREESQASKLRISRNNRKKYRAPPAPSYEPRDFFNDWDGKPSRRLRLFMTRAEAKKKSSQEHTSIDVVDSRQPLPPPSGRLRRSLSTPQFQQNQELERHYEEEPPPPPRPPPDIGRPPRVPPVQHNEPEVGNSFLEELREKQMMRENKTKRNESRNESRHSEVKKTDSTGQRQRDEENLWLATTKSPVPVKTFYFGMDEPVDDPFGFDTFSPKVPAASYSSSESQLSGSEGFLDYDENSEGISVHLRATLPRKQVDIPRFSPAAAWRLLSSAEISLPSPLPPMEEEVVESRIQAPPPIQIPALIPDKSADSGISGDASPQQFDSAAWTPQQDLEETSSDGFPTDFLQELRYTPRLSLSLPKESAEADKPVPNFSFDKPPFPFVKPFPDLDNNWMLSCSIPSSVNYTPREAEEEQPASLVKKPSFSYLSAGGHIMYLPEYSTEDPRALSKSCEDLSEPEPPPSKYKPKKFTFQSTIRQQERKEIADKLSRIAEYTELKRRSEQEVMRRVEEEFQKKREREKADIRQQLRLFNITNKAQLTSLETTASNP